MSSLPSSSLEVNEAAVGAGAGNISYLKRNNARKFVKMTNASNETASRVALTSLAPVSSVSDTVEYPFHPKSTGSISNLHEVENDHLVPSFQLSSSEQALEADSQLREESKPSSLGKRPLNSFMLYRKAKQGQVPSTDHRSISRIIGSLWRNESAETKQYYMQLAIEQRKQHAIDFPNYKFSPKKKLPIRNGPGRTKKMKPKEAQEITDRKRREERSILKRLLKGRHGKPDGLTSARQHLSSNGADIFEPSSFYQDGSPAAPWWTVPSSSTHDCFQNGPPVVEDLFLYEDARTSKPEAAYPSEWLEGGPLKSGLSINLPSAALSAFNVSLMSEREMDDYFASIKACDASNNDGLFMPYVQYRPESTPTWATSPQSFRLPTWDLVESELSSQ